MAFNRASTDVTAKGKHETLLLRANIQDQLNRLLTQLEDLEELKDEFTIEDYNLTKEETLSQLRDFQLFLEKSISGDMTLIDEFGIVQLAIQATVSDAFKTPEVIRMFAQKQPEQLRARLEMIQRDVKLGKMSKDVFNRQSVEILIALKKMGSDLSSDEQNFLNNMSSSSQLESAVDNVGDNTQQNIMNQASRQIQRAEK